MKVHHLNCGTMHAMGGLLPAQQPTGYTGIRLVCHCLLLELPDRLVLIDSGIGLHAMAAPDLLGPLFLKYSRPALDPAESALQQMTALGFAPKDVRDIVLTHLHHDHVSGTADFPWARLHIGADEFAAATQPPTQIEAGRYQPKFWDAATAIDTYPATGEAWHGFPAAHPLRIPSSDLALIALPGHSRGHCGVAINLGTHWLLHAGDAYFHHDTVDPHKGHAPAAHANIERSVQILGAERLANQQRLLALARTHSPTITLFCAHDAEEFERLQQSR